MAVEQLTRLFLAGLCSVLVAGCATQTGGGLVEFNERWIAHLQGGTADVGTPVDFDDPRGVLRFVLANAPNPAVVYPSEQYYYYRIAAGSRLISGNIRFVDVAEGGVSVGYFDTHNEQDMRVGEFRDSEGGVRIAWDEQRYEATLSLDGVTRRFIFDRSAFTRPSFPLLEGERLVSGVLDESGYYLYLMYHEQERAFYYVLNPDMPLPETLVRGESESVQTWFGEHSRFCFVRHPATDRMLLVGVHRREVMQNTWFDGPFDQVPPHLPIGGILQEAYPYVVDAGGIDEHGNFLRMHGQRVAISPYIAYSSGPELETSLESLITDDPSPRAWLAATYEAKRDWRPPEYPRQSAAHERDISRTWPPNHWRTSSRQWSDHNAEVSTSWPPSHESGASRDR